MIATNLRKLLSHLCPHYPFINFSLCRQLVLGHDYVPKTLEDGFVPIIFNVDGVVDVQPS